MITIDKLKFEDLIGLKALYEDGFEGSTTDFERMVESYNQIKENPNYTFLCAHLDDKLVGSVMGVACLELFGNCVPFMVVENVAVLSEYRKMGIAKQLMKQLEDHAIQQNCSMILFVSSAHRVAAHRLYESLGYSADKVNGYRKRLK
jgi:ribosomal protein S18 acetylase RimI-like enzyme